jgi:hypothetical protein
MSHVRQSSEEVMPAKAGISEVVRPFLRGRNGNSFAEIPAFAGMTRRRIWTVPYFIHRRATKADFFYCLCILLFLLSPETHAEIAPFAQIEDQVVMPNCVKVKTSHFDKGPAIQIENNCKTDVVVTDISTALTEEESKKPVSDIAAILKIVSGGVTRTKGYIFTGDKANCDIAERRLASHYSSLENLPQNVKDRIEEIRRENNLVETEVACGALPIPAGGALTIGIPYGTIYAVHGHIGSDDKSNFSAAGKMVNPQNSK